MGFEHTHLAYGMYDRLYLQEEVQLLNPDLSTASPPPTQQHGKCSGTGRTMIPSDPPEP